MEKSESGDTPGVIWEHFGKKTTAIEGASGVVAVDKPVERRSILSAAVERKCNDAVAGFISLGLTSLELGLDKIGLFSQTKGLPIVASGGEGKLIKPMQFIIKFVMDEKFGTTFQRMYLQQVLTPFIGGHFTPTKGYEYNVNTKKSTGIKRMIANTLYLEDEINGLIQESNRFLYMYCRTDKF